ncbi:NAD-dependent succinate-semialdehyde dehydrogenase [Candidatus Woesearchaeota archaeon]|nr:NAD-dependent succinate-semialdehyde dehydrogenase [Candidatus Woesearchaeota archaeon]
MKFKTTNPATGSVLAEYELMTKEAVMKDVERAHHAFLAWKKLSIPQRAQLFQQLARILRDHKETYATLMTQEMGKPIRQARAEIEKSAWTCEVYAEKTALWLKEEDVQADGKKNIVVFEPLGVIVSIMPWNFPFWQALRFAIPTMMAGNVTILKHSNLVPGCALAIESAFREAGFPEYVFTTILADHETVQTMIASDMIAGVSLTGSTEAGARIAELAGKHLKKVVLELGGSDPFIVLDDANVSEAANVAVQARVQNCGQSCISAKRFIVTKSVAQAFTREMTETMKKLIVGNPLQDETDVGPLSNEHAVTEMQTVVEDARKKGAIVTVGGGRVDRQGFFFQPTIITATTPQMQVVKEEIFGPIAPIIVVKDESEAIATANATPYGLGASIWTADEKKALKLARELEVGCVFINTMVKSDPRMPFGGIKKSGLGRELSKYGLREFVNVKAITLHEMKP